MTRKMGTRCKPHVIRRKFDLRQSTMSMVAVRTFLKFLTKQLLRTCERKVGDLIHRAAGQEIEQAGTGSDSMRRRLVSGQQREGSRGGADFLSRIDWGVIQSASIGIPSVPCGHGTPGADQRTTNTPLRATRLQYVKLEKVARSLCRSLFEPSRAALATSIQR